MKTAHALQIRELNLRLIVDSIPAPVALMTPAGQVESVNQPTLEYFGKTFEELKKWGTSDAVHPDDLSHAIAVWKEAIETGQPYEVKQRLRRFDGVHRWFGVRGFPLRDPNGRILNWCVLLNDIDDRERAEQALRASERNLSLNINAMPTLLASARPDGWGDFFNQRWLEYTGLSAKQLEGWGWATPLHPDDAESLLKIWRSSLGSGAPLEAEARMRRFDGAYRCHLFRANALRNESGNIVKWYGTAADIEERKQAEEKLRRSEADLQEAQRLTHTGSWKHDISSGNVTVSPETHRIFGSGPDEDTSSPEFWFGRIHPDDRQRVQELFQRCEIEKSDYQADYRLLLPDGTITHQHATGRPVCNESGELVEFVGTAMDVTEQVEARFALQKAFDKIEKSEDQLLAIIGAIPSMAWSTGLDGSVDFFNRRWLDYTGLSMEQAKGWGWVAAIHPDDVKSLVDRWRSSLASGSATEAGAEARMCRFDGAYRWFLFQANALRNESGSIVKWYGTSTDIEDRIRAEEQLRRSEAFLSEGQRLSSTGSFLHRVATEEVTFSEEMCRIFELEAPVSVGMIASRIHPEDLPLFTETLEHARRGDFPGRIPSDVGPDLRLLMPDGSVKYIRIISHMNRDEWRGKPCKRGMTNHESLVFLVGSWPKYGEEGGTIAAGLMDWMDVDPPEKAVGLTHGILNTFATFLFAFSFLMRWGNHWRPMLSSFLVALAGYVVVSGGAYLGGAMVYHMGVMINRNAYRKGPDDFLSALAVADLQEGHPQRVEVDGQPILLLRSRERIYAIGAVCSHYGAPLEEGKVQGNTIQCPWHFSRFALDDGSVCEGPACAAVPSYEVRVIKDQVEIKLWR